MGKNQQKKV